MKVTMFIQDPEVVHWQLKARHRTILQEAMPDAEIVWVKKESDFLDNLPQSEMVIVWMFKAEWLEKAPKLRCIATPAAGMDHLPSDLPDSIRVIRGRFHGKLMAETALSMLLTLCRNTDGWERAGREKAWPQAETAGSMRLLRGSHILLCGFGPIGQAVAKQLKAFDVRLTVVKKNPSDANPEYFGPQDVILTEREADEKQCWEKADFVVSILPGGAATTDFISRDRINRLPRGAGIINLGRGNAVDEEALMDAVERGHIRGAFLDVFKREPLPQDSRLRKISAIRLMPHLSAAAPEYLDAFMDELCRLTASDLTGS